MILRLSIAAASLAWAGFVFTHTVGDPDRGERIAEAVLADDAARAQVVSPITSAVMRSTGLPEDQRPFVATQVEQVLRRPDGARTFVETFAGGWSRMLGDDDSRGTRVDITPFVADVVAATPGLDPTLLPDEAAVPASVPIPRADMPWFGGLRRAVEVTIVPLALLAAIGTAIAFAIGDRRWVLLRIGIWAAVAGGAWLIGPLIAVWAARQWATGADEVVRVAVEEAVSGLRPAAIGLLACGIAAIVAAVVLPAERRVAGDAPRAAPAPRRDRRRPAAWEPERPVRSTAPGDTRRVPVVGAAAPRRSTVADTLTMPAQVGAPPPPTTPTPTPTTATTARTARTAASVSADDQDDADALWNFYTDPER